MKTKAAPKVIFERFENLAAFETALNRENNQLCGTESQETNYSGWAGTKTWAEADALYQNGDSATAARLNKGMEKLKTQLTTSRRTSEAHYYGASPIVARAIIGHPKAMRRTVQTRQTVKAIHLIYNPSCNCSYNAEQIFNAGFTMLEIIYRFELSGVRVALDVVPFSAFIGKREQYISLLKLKAAQQPLDVLRVAYPIAHTAFFRRHGFKLIESAPITERAPNYGYEEKREITEAELKKHIPGEWRYIKFHDIVRNNYDAEKVIQSLNIK